MCDGRCGKLSRLMVCLIGVDTYDYVERAVATRDGEFPCGAASIASSRELLLRQLSNRQQMHAALICDLGSHAQRGRFTIGVS